MVLAVFISMGFTLLSMSLRWDQQAPELKQMKVVKAQSQWR